MMQPTTFFRTFFAGMAVAALQNSVTSLFNLQNIPDIHSRFDGETFETLEKKRISQKKVNQLINNGLSEGNWEAAHPQTFPSLKRGREVAEFDYATRSFNASKIISEQHILPEEKQQLVEALLSGDWNAEIFKDDKRFPDVALAAFQSGEIGMEEFTNVLLYGAVRQHFSPSEIQVKKVYDSSGKLNLEATELLFKTMELENPYRDDENLKTSFLTPDQKLAFLHLLSKHPGSGHTFFMVPDISPKYQPGSNTTTITQLIQYHIKFGVFNRVEIKGKTYCIVPSYELMQTFLNVSSKKPVQLQTRVGISTFEEIQENGIQHKRDLMVPGYGVENPKTTDGFPAPLAFDGSLHDLYHADRASHVPSSHQHLYVEFSRVAFEKNSKFPLVERLSETISHKFADMEYPYNQLLGETSPFGTWSDSPKIQALTRSFSTFFVNIENVITSTKVSFFTKLLQESALNPNGKNSLLILKKIASEMEESNFHPNLARKLIASLYPKGFRTRFCAYLIEWLKGAPNWIMKQDHLPITYEAGRICANPWLAASLSNQLQ